MSITFTKLFSSITESTVWCEPDRTRLCWIAMLAMADRKGRVWASIPGLANRARVPIEDARIAIATFLGPDLDSRTPDHDGRRIEPIEGGWRLINYEKYREMRDDDERREYQREWDRTKRVRNPTKSDKSDQIRPQPTKAEAEANLNPMGGKPPVADLDFEETWKRYPKRSGNNPKADALKAWTARIKAGVPAKTMQAGLERYRAWCEATGKIGTETVMMAATFFGPSNRFEQDFSLPVAASKSTMQNWS